MTLFDVQAARSTMTADDYRKSVEAHRDALESAVRQLAQEVAGSASELLLRGGVSIRVDGRDDISLFLSVSLIPPDMATSDLID